jgi:hypothetical protein
MHFATAKRGLWHSWVSLLGIVCIALLLYTGVLRLTHHHPNGRIDPDCSLCMTAHAVAQVVVVVAVRIVSRPVERCIAEVPCAPLTSQRFVFKLANRPPPAVPAFA